MKRRFDDKAEARQVVWDALVNQGLARFPTPPHGRIPNFAGARQAAERLLEHEPWRGARRIKVNPDAPQLPLRVAALRRGIEVFVPTPRLRGGFNRLDPRRIDAKDLRAAASLSKMSRFAEPVSLDALPEMDAIVSGSVAVSPDGARCGKGEGYADIELAILRELGHPPVPVGTTVHDIQVVETLPRADNDLCLSLIVTPTDTLRVPGRPALPRLLWHRLDETDLDAMPILRELRDREAAT